MRVLFSVVAVTGLLAGPLVAQVPRGPVPMRVGPTAANGELRTASSATAELRRQVVADSLRQTQWLKGGVIGALVVGIPMALLGAELDRHSDSGGGGSYLVSGLVLGGAFGFFVGALIGGQFEE